MKTTIFKDTFIQSIQSIELNRYDSEAFTYIYENLIDWESNTGKEIEFYPTNIMTDWDQYTRDGLKEEYSHLDFFSLPDKELIEELNECQTRIIFHKVKDLSLIHISEPTRPY